MVSRFPTRLLHLNLSPLVPALLRSERTSESTLVPSHDLIQAPATMAANFKVPEIQNEPMVSWLSRW